MKMVDELIRKHPDVEEAVFTFKRIRKGILQYQAATKFKMYEVTLLPNSVVDLHKEECIERLFQADEEAVVSWSFVAGGSDVSRR